MPVLKDIEKASSTLAAALKAFLSDRPLRAKRFLGCCGMNTDQWSASLINNLESLKLQFTDQSHLSVGTGGFDGWGTAVVTSSEVYSQIVFGLLKKVRGVKVGELLLSDAARSFVRGLETRAERRAKEKEFCITVLQLWSKIEVLCDQAAEVVKKDEAVKNSFSKMIKGEIKSFNDLLEWFNRFYDAHTSSTNWLQHLRAFAQPLQDNLAAVADNLKGFSGGADVGKTKAHELLVVARDSLAKISEPQEAAPGSGTSVLLEQRAAVAEMSKVMKGYRTTFISGCSSGTNIGRPMMAQMIQRTEMLSILLREHGERLWNNYASYMLGIAGEEVRSKMLSDRVIKGKVGELLNKLDQQLELLQRFSANGGIKIQVGLNLPSTAALDDVVGDATDLLQIYEAEIFHPVTEVKTETASIVGAADRPMAKDVVSKAVVEDEVKVVLNGDVLPTDPEHAGISTAASAKEPSAVHPNFFPKPPPADLTEEQEARLKGFMAQVAATPKADGSLISDQQFQIASRFLTNILKRNVRNANMVGYLFADKISVSPNWIVDTGIKEKLERLLEPSVTTAPTLG